MSMLNHDQDHTIHARVMEPVDQSERSRLLAEAMAQIDVGSGVPHERVAAWLDELAAGRPAKPPCGG